jgi:hypothetical protein
MDRRIEPTTKHYSTPFPPLARKTKKFEPALYLPFPLARKTTQSGTPLNLTNSDDVTHVHVSYSAPKKLFRLNAIGGKMTEVVDSIKNARS